MNQLSHSVPPDVTHALWRLANFILSAYKVALDGNQIEQKKQLITSLEVTQFSYSEGSVNFQASPKVTEVTNLDPSATFAFLQNLKVATEYNEAKSALCQHSSKPAEVCENWLGQFASFLLNISGEADVEAKTLRIIKNLCDAVDGLPVWMNISAALSGVWLEEDSFVFGNYTARKPTPNDVRKIIDAPYGIQVWPIHGPLPMCYVDFNLKTSNQNDAQKELDYLVNVLSLVGVGSVTWSQMKLSTECPLLFGYQMGSGNHAPAFHKFKLSQSQSDALAKLFEITRPLMFEENPTDSLKSIMRALQRYRTALLDGKDVSSNIALAISSLEALFLRGTERSELKNRLSNRVALIFKCLGNPPLQVASQVGRAYDIRSTFVHGDDPPPEVLKNLPELRKEVFQIVRVSLLLFFQIQAELSKDDFISKLDKALLDDSALEKVKALLSNRLLFS